MKKALVAICLVLLASSSAFAIGSRAPETIGEEINLARVIESRGDVRGMIAQRDTTEERLIWSEELWFGGADYIAPHFSKFDLPEGARVVVRNPEGTRSWTYTGKGKDIDQPELGFWGVHIYGESAIVELFSSVPVRRGAVAIDRFARGFKPAEILQSEPEAICGTDDSEWAQCYKTSEPTIYDRSRAVARLFINGTSACTGWLVGSEGHVMTNEHCIGTSRDAQNTSFEFMAEGSCTTSCASWGACPGTIAATTSTLVKNDAALDYALVKLPNNPSTTYGYLQMRSSGAVLNERIYVPQHPAAWGKKIAVDAGSSYAKVVSLNATPCSGGPGDVQYEADTQGGSSGSPVLGYSDHAVVSLHHCGPCANRGVPIYAVVTSLGSLAPANSVVGGTPPPPPPPPGDDVITLSVTKKAKGKRITAQLRWNGSTASSVDVFRNSAKVTTTANDGAYDDSVTAGSYTYKVCNAGTSVCSNSVSMSF